MSKSLLFESAIKWSGSKRSQAIEILGYFPLQIKTDYEPFCGGCSVFNRLMHSEYMCGNSSFKRVIGKSNNSVVYESLYVKNNE